MTALAEVDHIAALLADDPVWAVYALADLQPEMAPYCRWFLHDDGAAHAVALLFDGLAPPILFAAGAPAALAAALARADLPQQVYLSIRADHAGAVARWYDHHDVRHMWRMVLRDTQETRRGTRERVAGAEDGFRRRRLTGADAPAVETLFRHGGPFTPDAFAAHQIELGVFYAIEDGHGELAAVGGTHIVDYRARLAAIGNMYTRPDCRGRGFANDVLAALVDNLRAAGVQLIVLNVDQRNSAARRIYERFGFAHHCAYLEGKATRHAHGTRAVEAR